jgi:hypothetical protein
MMGRRRLTAPALASCATLACLVVLAPLADGRAFGRALPPQVVPGGAIVPIPSAGGAGAAGAGSAAGTGSATGAEGRAVDPAAPDQRSVEVLRLDCASTLGRREVTLFGNGTIRVRDGALGKEKMGLAELEPGELDGVLHRLAEDELPEVIPLPPGMVGPWVEKCDLILQLAGRARRKFFFGRYDTLPLGLSRVVRQAQELGTRVATLGIVDHLPDGYQPRIGDVLKRLDGHPFQVVNFTSDKKGVELDGLDEPLHLVVVKDQLAREFVAVLPHHH